MSGRRWRTVLKWVGRGLAGLAALAVAALLVYVLVILPRTEMAGAHDVTPFQCDGKMAIEKRAPDGTPYTVNNSTATFRLDVGKPDEHSRLVFTNYAAALAYCREKGLPSLPSVQLVQGKLKQTDEALCAALELAMAGRREQALRRLLGALMRQPNAEAVEHVATALLLAGIEPDVDADVRRKAEARRDAFLATPDARPCGFWDGDARLVRSFQSDRYLMAGLSLLDSRDACLALSRAIVSDASLRAEFRTLRAFDAKLTNPAHAAAFEDLAGLTPQEVARRYPKGARFALVSYSVSNEQTLLEPLLSTGEANCDTCLMALVIDAVRSGRLKLDPKPDSGWYDYQWYALETLLAPERGRESAKLTLTDAYCERLENAFATALAKARETQIKRLSVMTLGCAGDGDIEPLPKVQVSPDFSAEPTLTVYLRLGRAYRFLLQALVATLGEEEFMRVRLGSSDRSVDEALHEAACFCYGLYERLCLEIGRSPEYLPDELTAAEREDARAVFSRWRDTWQADPALATDARVAVPVVTWPGGRTRYWGAAGVRLERVVYEYLDKPEVGGRVEAEFVPFAVYLPTDAFLEFERPWPEPLTRAEFRKLCDAGRDEASLRRAFAARTPQDTSVSGFDVWRLIRSYWVWAAAFVAVLVFWRVRRARLWIAIVSIMLTVWWGGRVFFCPDYRTAFLVRHVATINESLGLMCEERLARDTPLAPLLRGLAQVMSDPNPQIRYLAARFMASATYWHGGTESNAWFQVGVRESLMRAAEEPNPEIAGLAVMALTQYRDQEVSDLLMRILVEGQPQDFLCERAIFAMFEIRDPRAIPVLVSLCEDPRNSICWWAVYALGKYSQAEAQAQMWRLAESNSSLVRRNAIAVIKKNCPAWWGPKLSADETKVKCDRMLHERAENVSLPFEVRMTHAWSIEQEGLALDAVGTLLKAADSLVRTNQVLCCLSSRCLKQHGVNDLRRLPTVISNATPCVELARAASEKNPDAMKQALMAILCASTNGPDSKVNGFAQRALEELQREREPGAHKRRRGADAGAN